MMKRCVTSRILKGRAAFLLLKTKATSLHVFRSNHKSK